MSLLESLQKSGHLTSTAVALIENYVSTWKVSPYEAVLDCHVLTEEKLADAFAEQGFERIFQLRSEEIAGEDLAVLQGKAARHWETLPLGRRQNPEGAFAFVVADPSREGLVEQLESCIAGEIVLLVCERDLLRRTLRECYPLKLHGDGD